jgi:hypothetical protein
VEKGHSGQKHSYDRGEIPTITEEEEVRQEVVVKEEQTLQERVVGQEN